MSTRATAALAARAPAVSLRVGTWAWREARGVAERLRRDGMDAVDTIPPPPGAPDEQRATVVAALDLAAATCLVRAAVLQRWDADHGRPRPLVIGVARRPRDGFAAHAWLEGEGGNDDFVELHRRLPG